MSKSRHEKSTVINGRIHDIYKAVKQINTRHYLIIIITTIIMIIIIIIFVV